MTISIAPNPLAFIDGQKLTAAEVNHIQNELAKCVDGYGGGIYNNLQSPIRFGGQRVYCDSGMSGSDVTVSNVYAASIAATDIDAVGLISASALGVTNDLSVGGDITAGGSLTVGNVSASAITASGTISTTSNITASGNITATGNVGAHNLTASLNATITGDLTANNATLGNTLTVNGDCEVIGDSFLNHTTIYEIMNGSGRGRYTRPLGSISAAISNMSLGPAIATRWIFDSAVSGPDDLSGAYVVIDDTNAVDGDELIFTNNASNAVAIKRPDTIAIVILKNVSGYAKTAHVVRRSGTWILAEETKV